MKVGLKNWIIASSASLIVAIVFSVAGVASADTVHSNGPILGMLDRVVGSTPDGGFNTVSHPAGPTVVAPVLAPESGYVVSNYQIPRQQAVSPLIAPPSAAPQAVASSTAAFRSKWGGSGAKLARPRLAGVYTNNERPVQSRVNNNRYKRSTHERSRPEPTRSATMMRRGPQPVDTPDAIVLTSFEMPEPQNQPTQAIWQQGSREPVGANSVTSVPTWTPGMKTDRPMFTPPQSTIMHRIETPQSGDSSGAELTQPRVIPVSYEDDNFGVTGDSEGGDPLDQEAMRSWLSQLSWRKGDFTLTPYGYVEVATTFETQRTFPGEFALWVDQPLTGVHNAFYIDAKSTRLGFDLVGPNISFFGECLRSAARVEFDFQGHYVTRNKPGVLFREGYIELKNSRWRFLAGQAWEVISPLLPGDLSYAPGEAAGCIGYRRPQIRVERYVQLNSHVQMDLQGSINMVIPQDFAGSTTDLDFPSGWPILEGRIAWQFGRRTGPYARPTIFGISAHIGEEEYDFMVGPNRQNVSRRTWSINADLVLPLTQRLALRGEIYTGENLAAFAGGIYQGIDPNTHRTIRDKGGWFDIEYRWTNRTRSYFGFSVDNPFRQDMTTGRTLNQYYFVNLIHNVTKQFEIAGEVTALKTLYFTGPAGNSTRFTLMMRYRF